MNFFDVCHALKEGKKINRLAWKDSQPIGDNNRFVRISSVMENDWFIVEQKKKEKRAAREFMVVGVHSCSHGHGDRTLIVDNIPEIRPFDDGKFTVREVLPTKKLKPITRAQIENAYKSSEFTGLLPVTKSHLERFIEELERDINRKFK